MSYSNGFSDSAFYSISNDSITLPLKSQFKDGESFYGTELHEMGHSTGVKNRLNRKGFYEMINSIMGVKNL